MADAEISESRAKRDRDGQTVRARLVGDSEVIRLAGLGIREGAQGTEEEMSILVEFKYRLSYLLILCSWHFRGVNVSGKS